MVSHLELTSCYDSPHLILYVILVIKKIMKLSIKKITPIFLILSSLTYPEISLSQSNAIHSIITFTGKVTIQKPNWKTPQLAFVGLTLKSEDTLIISPNASISVYCSNLKPVEFKQQGTYKVSDKCPTGQAVIQRSNSNNRRLRGDNQSEEARAKLPYLISPRETNILTSTPLLRWNQVSGTTAYTVQIRRWKEETNETEITYSGEPLKEGRRYRVTIITNNGAKEEETVGFTLLDKDTQEKVLNEVKTINQLTLSTEEKSIILAQLYRSYELYSDAINVLEDLIKQGSQTLIVYQLLGETYLDTKLPQLAKNPYEKALQLAIGTENVSVQADIQKGLGETYNSFGNNDEAVKWLEKAKANYTTLGDSLQVQVLDSKINLILERN